jgi:hypothetical protein
MATKSGFSKGWQGFVDHKWIKKCLGISVAVVPLQKHFQEFVRAGDCSRRFPNDFALAAEACWASLKYLKEAVNGGRSSRLCLPDELLA